MLNMMIFCGIICSAIVFAMLGLHDLAGVIGIGIPFGLFSGACKFLHLNNVYSTSQVHVYEKDDSIFLCLSSYCRSRG